MAEKLAVIISEKDTACTLMGNYEKRTPPVRVWTPPVRLWKEDAACKLVAVCDGATCERGKVSCVGLARTIYIQCIYGVFGREIIKYTVIYGVYIRFWPTLVMCRVGQNHIYIFGVYTVCLAGESPHIQCIYRVGQNHI